MKQNKREKERKEKERKKGEREKERDINLTREKETIKKAVMADKISPYLYVKLASLTMLK